MTKKSHKQYFMINSLTCITLFVEYIDRYAHIPSLEHHMILYAVLLHC